MHNVGLKVAEKASYTDFNTLKDHIDIDCIS